MKVLHWLAVAVLTLLTLMNLGAVGGDSPTGVVVFGVVLGLAGLITLYGLVRRTTWGPVAGVGLAIANVLSAVIGGIAGWEGWQIGLGVSLVATVLVVISESSVLPGRRVTAVN